MEHKITIRPDSKHDREKFLTACACGTEGRFVTLEEAKQYADFHAARYGLAPDAITVLDTSYVAPGFPVFQKPATATAAAKLPTPPASAKQAVPAVAEAPKQEAKEVVPETSNDSVPEVSKGAAAE